MANSVYKVIELIGSSPNSWEEAVSNAVAQAGQELRELRVAEVYPAIPGRYCPASAKSDLIGF